MSGEIVSTGQLGRDFNRSEGRAYENKAEILDSFQQLEAAYYDFANQAQELGRRRTVLRAICTREVFQHIDRLRVPVEVAYPLSIVDPQNPYFMIMLGENIHGSDVPEWPEIYDYWHSPKTLMQPRERISRLDSDFHLTSQLSLHDAIDLQELWFPFGWTTEGVTHFIERYNSSRSNWFSGVREKDTGRLVSACTGEQLDLPEASLIESTEFGTRIGYEGKGLCTAAVVGLTAQILRDTVHSSKKIPILTAEFDMSSRSDVVGRLVGMVAPLLSQHLDRNTPIQTLSYNVSVLDRQPINSINWRDLSPQDREKYRDAYRTTHRFWRNFIVGVLPHSSLETMYSEEDVTNILSQISES